MGDFLADLRTQRWGDPPYYHQSRSNHKWHHKRASHHLQIAAQEWAKKASDAP